jgi:hypothetical protein
MSNEFQLTYTGTTATLVGLLQNGGGQFYNTNTTGFETYNASNIAYYAAVLFSEITATSEYLGSMPSGIAAGKYRLTVYSKAGASLAASDIVAASWITSSTIEWKGSAELSNAADLFSTETSNATAISSLTTSTNSLSTNVTNLATSVSSVASNVVAAVKADAVLSKTFNRTLGKFSYNPTNGVLILYEDDGVTVVGTVTITASSGTITSRA